MVESLIANVREWLKELEERLNKNAVVRLGWSWIINP